MNKPSPSLPARPDVAAPASGGSGDGTISRYQLSYAVAAYAVEQYRYSVEAAFGKLADFVIEHYGEESRRRHASCPEVIGCYERFMEAR